MSGEACDDAVDHPPHYNAHPSSEPLAGGPTNGATPAGAGSEVRTTDAGGEGCRAESAMGMPVRVRIEASGICGEFAIGKGEQLRLSTQRDLEQSSQGPDLSGGLRLCSEAQSPESEPAHGASQGAHPGNG